MDKKLHEVFAEYHAAKSQLDDARITLSAALRRFSMAQQYYEIALREHRDSLPPYGAAPTVTGDR